jgi:hypothetical protein
MSSSSGSSVSFAAAGSLSSSVVTGSVGWATSAFFCRPRPRPRRFGRSAVLLSASSWPDGAAGELASGPSFSAAAEPRSERRRRPRRGAGLSAGDSSASGPGCSLAAPFSSDSPCLALGGGSRSAAARLRRPRRGGVSSSRLSAGSLASGVDGSAARRASVVGRAGSVLPSEEADPSGSGARPSCSAMACQCSRWRFRSGSLIAILGCGFFVLLANDYYSSKSKLLSSAAVCRAPPCRKTLSRRRAEIFHRFGLARSQSDRHNKQNAATRVSWGIVCRLSERTKPCHAGKEVGW